MPLISRSDSLKTLALKGCGLGLLLALFTPLILEYFFYQVPDLDANTQAYLYILQGLKTGQYAKAKEMFDFAYSSSNDPEIHYVADFDSQACQISLSAGNSSFEESSSVGGSIKAFLKGFLDPLSSIDAGSLLLRKFFGDFDKDCRIIDERYRPRFANYMTAWNSRKNAMYSCFWIFLIGTPVAFVVYAQEKQKKL